ncbi:MAG: hypothetical protein D6718_00635 [Acidobacteria bacterium]|nr:MAG: hypothetical protein D6718_00635 [Acidobacteriota bacterium]
MRLLARLAAFRRRRRIVRCLRSPARALVLRYHSVAPAAEAAGYLDPGLSIPPERFAEHVRLLAERFEVIGLDELLNRASTAPRGRPAVVVTFDDGYRDNHDHALPILKAAGLSATFYVTTGPLAHRRGLWISEVWRCVPRLPEGRLELPGIPPLRVPAAGARRGVRRRLTRELSALGAADRERALAVLAEAAGLARGEGLGTSFMTPEQVLALRDAGMTVGAHTRSHPHLDRLPADRLEEEVAGSRADLEAVLDEPVVHFAYPNPGGGGRNAGRARRAVASAGFRTAVTSRCFPIRPGQDPLLLPRAGVYAGPSERGLFAVLARCGRG